MRKPTIFLAAMLVALGLLFAEVPLLAQAPPKAESNVIEGVSHAVSAPLHDFVPFSHELPAPVMSVLPLHKPGGSGRGGTGGGKTSWTDPDLQTDYFSMPPAPTVSFDGISANGSIPPDTNLAVGSTQVVEMVNTEFAVYNKAGKIQLGPAPIHTIFASVGGMCGSSDGGDPIVLYDQLAQRWLISQLAYNTSFTSNLLCVAISTTADATGSYFLYAFDFGRNLPDYPKLGVWPDGYYLSANLFRNGSSFIGAAACAFNRGAMLAGSRSNLSYCFQGTTSLYNLLPSNLDGATGALGTTLLPPSGEPNFFLQFVSNALNLYKFHVDWNNLSHSTFLGTTVGVKSFLQACGGGACIPQQNVTQQLDSLGDRLMYRLSYRNFGSYESLLVNHSVQVRSTSNQTGIRWYEIRTPNGTPTVAQESTFAPDTATYRWMGSMAQDKQGNMFLGYSTSNSALYPTIGYTGRAVDTSTLNQMMGEATLAFGSGSQTTYNRWGDYASVALDPSNDCTFWFATEYLPYTGVFNWNTHVASVRFSGCQ